MLKTVKTVFISTIVLVAALFAAVYIVPTVTSKMKEDESNVLVVVTFDPSPRTGKPIQKGGQLTDVVTIIVSIGSTTGGPAHVTPDKATVSPWERFFYVPPGVKMTVSADQFTGGNLACSIQYRRQAPVRKQTSGPSGVTCVLREPA